MNIQFDVRVLQTMLRIIDRNMKQKVEKYLDCINSNSELFDSIAIAIHEDRVEAMRIAALIQNDGIADRNQFLPISDWYAVLERDMRKDGVI